MQTNDRFLALDIFRGMTIALMIIVNTPGNWGSTYAPLLHADWNDFTPTDLVFPSFMFAVGNAMSFVMLKWSKMSQSQVFLKILKRTFIIFIIGFLGYWFPFFYLDENREFVWKSFADTRVFGVLQRIGIAYGIAGFVIYYLKPKQIVYLSIALLLSYALILGFYGNWDMANNPVRNLDLWLVGERHMYVDSGVKFDPEGLLSTLPSIVNILAGFLAGKYIQTHVKKSYEGLAKMMLVGFALLVVAFMWNYQMPINKKMWTSSYVLLTVGLDLLILGAIIYYYDFSKKTTGSFFFQVLGKNPLAIYLLSELLIVVLYMVQINKIGVYAWIYENIFSKVGAYFGSFLIAVSYMLLCWSVGYWMDKRKIYVRI